MITREELAEIKRRADAATPGLWLVAPETCGPDGQGVYNEEDFGCICEVGDPYPRGNNRPQENMEFIAYAREDIPRLLTEIERLRSKLDDAESLLTEAHDIMDDVHLYDSEIYRAISEYFDGSDIDE